MKSIGELGITAWPWTFHPSTYDEYAWIETSQPGKFPGDGNEAVGGGCDEDADVRLMAAAPDLYEALRLACGSCIDCCEDCSDCLNFNRSWMPTARAALEKAGGAE